MREELDIPMAIQGSQIYPGEHYNKIQTALKQSTVREDAITICSDFGAPQNKV